ncbi:MAG: ATP-dependent helicase [Deltaproteobacteria bacterium]|nr:ATP-dependent helicase [Deltaproteobacteria bacterium]
MKHSVIDQTASPPEQDIFTIPYEQVLNPSQLEAVTTLDGPVLVIAGAGSGKTRTLTYRVARLVESGIPPGAILLLTFTRKAAQEMLRRATELLDYRCEKVAGGTFHSFANVTLRRFSAVMGFDRGFTIMDRADMEDAIAFVARGMHLDKGAGRLPRKRTLATILSKAVNKGVGVEEVVSVDYPNFMFAAQTLVRLQRIYQAYKKEHALVDYDDLLVILRDLLRDHEGIRQRLSEHYRYVMVDEYQDTNKIQADIVRLLAGRHRNVMVVGDDSQCIYAFRGARFANIMAFPQIFPGTKVIKLEENYRSTQPILDLTNAIIGRASRRYTKVLFTRKPGGTPPVLAVAEDERTQSRFVVRRIQELQTAGVPLGDIAVLFRSGFHSFDLEIELNRANIAFVKVGGFKFMETAHIKDLLAHMKVLINPEDALSWHRILLLLESVGPKAADEIFRQIVNTGNGVAALATVEPKPRYRKAFERFKATMLDLDPDRLSVAETGARIVHYYQPILERRFDNHPKRSRDLEHVLSIMAGYDTLDRFLADMALEPPTASVDGNLAVGKDHAGLVLSTIHSAKGLEWHTVFIIWALDGRFPSIYATRSEQDLEEELRLMYVAATRAQENLYISYPANIYDRTTATLLYRPSRFIDGIGEHILEPCVLTHDGDGLDMGW